MLPGYRAACLALPEKFVGADAHIGPPRPKPVKPNQTRSVPKSFEEGAGLCVFIGRIFMSAVTLLCADRPLPLYESGVRRVETSSHGGYTVRIEASGFSVGEHTYYREAVEDLCLTMKPCRYELDLRATQEDAAELRAYLAKHLRPGETVELWNLWVGDGPARPRRFSGALGDVELDTLKQLEENFQTCLTIRI